MEINYTNQTANVDYYQNDSICVERLVDEYERYGMLIVAYDYDNTVFDYSRNDNKCSEVIKLLRECKQHGCHLTVFTSCNDDRIPEIEKYLTGNAIPFDSINETPDFIPFRGRKVYYNILLDDRAGLSSAMNILWRVMYTIRGKQANKNLDDFG